MICTSCGRKGSVVRKHSQIFPEVTLYLCEICISQNYEPRAVIIIAARKRGIDEVAEYIKHHRYLGNEITATELL